jgi:hypothetical protein
MYQHAAERRLRRPLLQSLTEQDLKALRPQWLIYEERVLDKDSTASNWRCGIQALQILLRLCSRATQRLRSTRRTCNCMTAHRCECCTQRHAQKGGVRALIRAQFLQGDSGASAADEVRPLALCNRCSSDCEALVALPQLRRSPCPDPVSCTDSRPGKDEGCGSSWLAPNKSRARRQIDTL